MCTRQNFRTHIDHLREFNRAVSDCSAGTSKGRQPSGRWLVAVEKWGAGRHAGGGFNSLAPLGIQPRNLTVLSLSRGEGGGFNVGAGPQPSAVSESLPNALSLPQHRRCPHPTRSRSSQAPLSNSGHELLATERPEWKETGVACSNALVLNLVERSSVLDEPKEWLHQPTGDQGKHDS